MHLGLAAETLDVGLEVALVGADRAAQRVVVLEGGAEAEGQYGGELEAIGDDAGVILGGLLVHPGSVFRAVFGDDDRQIAGRKEESLITEQTRDPGQGHWAAVTAKFRKCLSFCNAIGIPSMFISFQSALRGLTAPSGSWLCNSYRYDIVGKLFMQ